MARLKGKQTFRQFLEKKDYKIYRHYKDKIMFSLRDAIELVDEWEEEKEKLTKKEEK